MFQACGAQIDDNMLIFMPHSAIYTKMRDDLENKARNGRRPSPCGENKAIGNSKIFLIALLIA
jgi:hypothetical protein